MSNFDQVDIAEDGQTARVGGGVDVQGAIDAFDARGKASGKLTILALFLSEHLLTPNQLPVHVHASGFSVPASAAATGAHRASTASSRTTLSLPKSSSLMAA